MVLDVVDDLFVTGDEPAQRGEGFAERRHDQIDIVGHVEVGRGAAAAAQHANGVRIVDHQAGAVLLAERYQLGQGRDITFHAEQPIDHHQDALACRQAGQDTLEIGHAVVAIAFRLAPAQPSAVHDAGVIFFVEDHDVSTADQRTDRSQVGLHAGGKDEGRFFAHPGGQLAL